MENNNRNQESFVKAAIVTKNSRYFFVTIVILALAVIAGGVLYMLSDPNSAKTDVKNTVERVVGEKIVVAQFIDNNCFLLEGQSFNETCDSRVIGIDKQGKSNVLIENTGDFGKGTLAMHYYTPDGSKILFRELTFSSSCSRILMYEVEKKELRSEPVLGCRKDSYVDSPDHRRFVNIGEDGRSLFVTDLISGIEKKVVEVEPTETLVFTIGDHGGEQIGNYGWVGNHTVRYDIYNANEKIEHLNNDGEGSMQRTVVRSEWVEV